MTKPHITKRGGKWMLFDLWGNDVFDTLELAITIAKYRHKALKESFVAISHEA